jgi:ATP-binding cassette subfamily C protein
MRLLITFLRAYPTQSVITLAAILSAGLIEGFGFALLLPLLSVAVSGNVSNSAVPVAHSNSQLEQMVNQIFGAFGITPTIGLLLIIFVATMLLKSLIMLVTKKRVGYTSARVTTDLRLEFIKAVFATRWEFFINQPIGKLANSVGGESNRSSSAYLSGIQMIASSIQAIIYGAIVFMISWEATLAALAIGILMLVLLSGFIEKSKQAGIRQTQLSKSMMTNMIGSFMMIKPLKTMAREHLAGTLLKKEAARLKKALKNQVFAATALSAFQQPVTIAFLASGLYFAIVVWKLPMANMLVLVYMFRKLLRRLQKVQKDYQGLVVSESAYWSFQDRLKAAISYKEQTMGTRQVALNRCICFDHVGFAYAADSWVLKNSNFDFPAGSFTAIVGPSGVGKTTVVDLITGLLRPQEGEIFIDDIPLAEINIRHWRQMIGYVPQETILLHDTIYANVTIGDKKLSEKDIEYALRASGAWVFVQALPKGINTIVGERGHKLSGGQRQRIAIARALIHKPKLLILDEATTALDPNTEKAICNTLRKLRGELTIIAISHQPAVLEVADRAYRLENRIASPVQVGLKDELQIERVHADVDGELHISSVSGKIQ